MSFVLFNINSAAKVMQTYDMGKEKHKFSPQSTGKSSESRQQGQKRADTKAKEEKKIG